MWFCLEVLILVLSWTTWATAQSSGNTTNTNPALALPSCVVTCAADVLPTYSCKPTNICFCTNDDLAASLKACLVKSCQTQDQLKAQKFRADTCGLPVRDKSSVVRGLVWSLFAIATFFTIARLLSRWPRLNGAGYHWDDWTLFALYPLAIVLLYAVNKDIDAGYGRDI